MVAVHTNPYRVASSHVASVPQVAVATAMATRAITNVCLSIGCTLQLYQFKFAITVLMVFHLCALWFVLHCDMR